VSDVRHPGTMTDAGAVQRETQDARERAADERQVRADEREQLAEERERNADERDARADERERLADERERAADLRETELDDREHALIERSQQLSTDLEDLEERTLATIERSRILLARSGQRLSRQEEAVRRHQARRERQQAEIDRASAETERSLGTWWPDPAPAIERSRKLRQKAVAAIETFAANEEQIARLHEDLAAGQPSRRGEHRQLAEQARDTARKAREILGSDTTDLPSQLGRMPWRPSQVLVSQRSARPCIRPSASAESRGR
jgi:chromosome segregation ATPase